MKLQSVLKIDNEEVEEVAGLKGLRFYLTKCSSSMYIGTVQGEVFARVDTEYGQCSAYVSEIHDLTGEKAEKIHG